MTDQEGAGRHILVRAGFATEQAVYGVLLVAGLIVIASLHATSTVEVLVVVVTTVVVFWAAHIYAGTIARHGLEDKETSLGEAFRAAQRASAGLLVAALVPCLFLLLGTLRIVPDGLSAWLALSSCILILGVLGYIAFERRGAPMHRRLLGALATASFGGVLALLKAIVH